MFRFLLLTIAVAAVVSMPGCLLGPHGGCGQCNSCDSFVQGETIHHSPLDSFRAWRRSLSCNSGCGETYWDEWYSTPPDCVDPCPTDCCETGFSDCGCTGSCGCDLVGGYGPAVRPLHFVGAVVAGLYGKRFCGGCGYGYDECGCGDGFIDGEIIEGGEYMEGTIIEGDASMIPASPRGNSGCATGNCAAASQPQRSTMARTNRRSPAYQQAMGRQQGSGTGRSAQPRNYRQAARLPNGSTSMRR